MGSSKTPTPEEMLPALYGELRRLAGSLMRTQPGGITIQTTALVHEAYLKLAGKAGWNDRTHFVKSAVRTMRSVLVDLARARAAQKRGGGALRITFDENRPAGEPVDDVLFVHEALDRLERVDAFWARVVELRFFGGLTLEETGAALECSAPTVHRAWGHARTWLFRELSR